MSLSTPIKHLLIVNGVQFNKDLSPNLEFITRLEKVIEIVKLQPIDKIIISGGSTRSKYMSEASFGEQYLQKHTNISIFKEEKSHTTIENIKFTKIIITEHDELKSDNIEKIIVVTTSKRLFRLKYLYKKIHPEIVNKIEFIVAPYPQPTSLTFLETLYLFYSMFDINERFLARFIKRALRNKEN